MSRLYTHRLLPILLLIAFTVWIDLPHPKPVRIETWSATSMSCGVWTCKVAGAA
jgi:hypothetical protein